LFFGRPKEEEELLVVLEENHRRHHRRQRTRPKQMSDNPRGNCLTPDARPIPRPSARKEGLLDERMKDPL
jgi:hypothetical protein